MWCLIWRPSGKFSPNTAAVVVIVVCWLSWIRESEEFKTPSEKIHYVISLGIATLMGEKELYLRTRSWEMNMDGIGTDRWVDILDATSRKWGASGLSFKVKIKLPWRLPQYFYYVKIYKRFGDILITSRSRIVIDNAFFKSLRVLSYVFLVQSDNHVDDKNYTTDCDFNSDVNYDKKSQ